MFWDSWILWCLTREHRACEYRACEILKCLRKKGKKMRGWEKRETHHWIDHSEISQIIDKRVCPVWFCLGLMPLKSISQEQYIVLSYNIGCLHCGHRLMTEFWAALKGPFKTTPIQHRTNRSEFKSTTLKLRVDELLSKWLRLEKLRGQSDCREAYSIDDTINEHYPNR